MKRILYGFPVGVISAVLTQFPGISAAAEQEIPAHRHPFNGPNGGAVEHLGPYHAEFVTQGNVVNLFIRQQDGSPVATSDFRANVVLVSGTVRRASFGLSPAGRHRLSSTASAIGGTNVRAIVTLITPDGLENQAGFAFKRKR